MTRLFASLALLLSIEAVASADISPNELSISTFDPENAVAPVSAVEGPGIKVGEGTVIHPVFGLETGVVSNVFYDAADPRGAGLLRLLAQIGAGSMNGARLTPANSSDDGASPPDGKFQYRASLGVSYDLMLSGNDAVSGTGGLGIGGLLRGVTNPSGKWSFGFDENYMRLIRAANFETDANTNRDINTLGLKLLYHPPEASVTGYLYYNNTLDIFERSQQEFANRFQNKLGLHPQWRWLPQTVLFADISQGIYTGIGASKKQSSFPLTAVAGIQTLLSLKTTFSFQAGYTNGFYGGGPSYSAPTIGASLGYRYTPTGRAVLTYDWMYTDSVNANYYRDHVIRLSLQQLFAPFVLMAQPELHFREYSGVNTIVMGAQPTRDDVIISVVAGLHYNFRNWIAATLDYHFTDVTTNYLYMAAPGLTDDPSFVRHELLLGMRVAM